MVGCTGRWKASSVRNPTGWMEQGQNHMSLVFITFCPILSSLGRGFMGGSGDNTWVYIGACMKKTSLRSLGHRRAVVSVDRLLRDLYTCYGRLDG
jgi:hypothetical protein